MPEGRPLSRRDALAICRHIGKKHGYAIAEHGTRSRDLDLLAVPWTRKARPVDQFLESLEASLPAKRNGVFEMKPHGRIALALVPAEIWGDDNWYIDLSVIQPWHYEAEEAVS